MIVYGDPETWGMTVDQFLDFRRLERESFANGTNPKIKMILDMLRRGMDVDTISTITGATIEEINSVAKKAKPISTEKPVGPEEGISKNKTYSEIDILSNIEAKFPGGNTRDDIVYNPMPNPVPRMDEYMPEFEGLEDPRYRQSELADGGIVEREGFANGKKLKPYGMTSYEMDQARIDNLNFEIEKRNKLGVKTIAPQLEKSTGYERSNINKLIQKGRVTRPLSKEELVTQYINKAIAENKTIGEMTKKLLEIILVQIFQKEVKED
jgi:predicted DNA-binding transcriptional regulator